MAKFEGGIIHPTARYRTQSDTQARGVYNLKEQYRHVANSNWPTRFPGWPSNSGERITCTITETSSSGDSAGAYQVAHAAFDNAYNTGATGRLYLAIKNTASGSTAYYNDFAIGAVQLRSAGDTTLNHGWSFSVAADYTDWEYATVTGLNTSDDGYENYYDPPRKPNAMGEDTWKKTTLPINDNSNTLPTQQVSVQELGQSSEMNPRYNEQGSFDDWKSLRNNKYAKMDDTFFT